MKKIIVLIAVIIIILVSRKENSIVIPYNATRFRIIANSNRIEDQINKTKVETTLTKYIEDIVKDKKPTEVKKTLLNNKTNIDNTIKETLKENNIDTNYKLSIGNNYFPKKIYHGITYDEGYYDSIVITLGKGNGLNWWCVMYPPLCLIDENKDSYEYTTIVKEILNKYKM